MCVNRHVFEVDGTGNCNITSMECNDARDVNAIHSKSMVVLGDIKGCAAGAVKGGHVVEEGGLSPAWSWHD